MDRKDSFYWKQEFAINKLKKILKPFNSILNQKKINIDNLLKQFNNDYYFISDLLSNINLFVIGLKKNIIKYGYKKTSFLRQAITGIEFNLNINELLILLEKLMILIESLFIFNNSTNIVFLQQKKKNINIIRCINDDINKICSLIKIKNNCKGVCFWEETYLGGRCVNKRVNLIDDFKLRVDNVIKQSLKLILFNFFSILLCVLIIKLAKNKSSQMLFTSYDNFFNRARTETLKFDWFNHVPIQNWKLTSYISHKFNIFNPLITDLILVCICAPIVEELYFRGTNELLTYFSTMYKEFCNGTIKEYIKKKYKNLKKTRVYKLLISIYSKIVGIKSEQKYEYAELEKNINNSLNDDTNDELEKAHQKRSKYIILFTSALFGLQHLCNGAGSIIVTFQIVRCFFLGKILSEELNRGGNILGSIMTHFFNNAIATFNLLFLIPCMLLRGGLSLISMIQKEGFLQTVEKRNRNTYPIISNNSYIRKESCLKTKTRRCSSKYSRKNSHRTQNKKFLSKNTRKSKRMKSYQIIR